LVNQADLVSGVEARSSGSTLADHEIRDSPDWHGSADKLETSFFFNAEPAAQGGAGYFFIRTAA
jgi:hypothetical protein